MELVTSLLTFAKGVFPATVGSVIAVWRKRKEVKLEEMNDFQRMSLVIVVICAIIVGVCIGKWVGGAIALYFGIEQLANFKLLGGADYLLQNLGFYHHFIAFTRGLIDTQDVFYFLLVIGLSLFLAKVFVEKKK